MSDWLKHRPWSSIALALCGLALIVGATIRLKDVPSRLNSARLWQRDPASVTADYAGLLCLVLAAWHARVEKTLDDTNDPADDPIARLDEPDPVPRPPDYSGKHQGPT
jgi:hypothetical protein